VFTPPVDFPTHERCVEIDVDLGCGTASAETIGGDLTHEYVTENADYRS
jgi:glutamate N-acetyltransferase/amino-acid N-acetyltransferase